MTDTKAVLFDSGDTLIYPSGGEWLPGETFRQMLQDRNVAHDSEQLAEAHRVAFAELERDESRCLSEDDEVERFERYFRLLFDQMANPRLDPKLVQAVARATVARLPVEIFPDTVPALERLRARGLRLGIISNGWPSLDRRYRELGLRHFFEVFVVSAHLGLRKPDPRIFEHAAAQLGLPPQEVVFVDDAAVNVEAACTAGFRGVLLARNGAPIDSSSPWIWSLEQIDRFL